MKITISSIDTIHQAANDFIRQVAEISPRPHVIAFYGKMGVGKTTFIKALCECLGVDDVITSPTFAIVNEYTLPSTSPQLPSFREESVVDLGGDRPDTLFHFDFYRIHRLEEVYDMGYEDYFYAPHALCFIEWPELIEDILPPDALRVTISEQPDGSRTIEWG